MSRRNSLGLLVGVLVGFASMASAETLINLTPGTVNGTYGTTPALPALYTGQANMLLTANSPSVLTTASAIWFEDDPGTINVSSLPTNIFNDNSAPTVQHNGTPYAVIFTSSTSQKVAFSSLPSAAIDYVRVWYDGYDRTVGSFSVYATSATLASGDLLDTTKYTSVYTGAGTLHQGIFTTPGDNYVPVYRDIAISANNTKSILFDVIGPNPSYQPRLYEIQAFGAIPEPATMSLLALGGLAMLRRRRLVRK